MKIVRRTIFSSAISINPQLQRLGVCAQRIDRRAQFRRAHSGAFRHSPGAAGRRARLPAPPRPRVSLRAQAASHEAGQRIRLKQNIRLLSQLLADLDGHCFDYYVLSAAPQDIVQSALEGILPENHIIGTEFRYDEATGEIESIARVPAGYGKVAVLDALRARLPLSHHRIVYVGDGSSDVHSMMHVNRLDGLTIAVSENRYITQIARRTVLSDDALSVLVPVLEAIVGWNPIRIREFFEAQGFALREWEKVQTDSLTICPVSPVRAAAEVV